MVSHGFLYSETCLETTTMSDHLSWRATSFWQKVIYLQGNWTCHQRPPVLTDPIFMVNGAVLQYRFYCIARVSLCGNGPALLHYSETCLERPMLWGTTCLEWPHISCKTWTHISTLTCHQWPSVLRDQIFMVNGAYHEWPIIDDCKAFKIWMGNYKYSCHHAHVFCWGSKMTFILITA